MRFIKKEKGFLLLLFLIISTSCFAQNDFGNFLKSSEDDLAIKEYSNQVAFLNKKPYRLSAIQNIQFRVGNSRIDGVDGFSDRNRFGLRFTIANPWEIRNNNLYFKSYEKSLLLEKELSLKEILSLKYFLVIDLIELKELNKIKEELAKNIGSQIYVFEQQKSSGFFDAKDYTDLKLKQIQEQTEIETNLFEIEQKIREIKKAFSSEKIDTTNWSTGFLIPINDIVKVTDSLLKLDLYSTTMSYLQQRVDVKEREYYLEKSNFNLATIQPTYNPFRLERDLPPFGLALGVTIPLVNPNKGDMTKRKLGMIEAQSELNLEMKDAQAKLEDLSASLKSYVERYNSVDKKISAFDADKTFSTVGALNAYNPIVLLKFQEQVLKLRKLKGELASEIYRTYISLLTTSDLIQKKPIINYLSKDLKSLD